MVRSEFVPIVKKFTRGDMQVHIYPVSDLHLGAAECDVKKFKHWIKVVLEDPIGYAVFCGDMINNGIKDSRTNVYEEVLKPHEQTELLITLLQPLASAGKILCYIPGNHEDRSGRMVDYNPAKETCERLLIPEVYRSHAGFLKIALGAYDKKRQFVYSLMCVHGSSRCKHDKFCSYFEGVDCTFSGHDHQPRIQCYTKMRFDIQHEAVVSLPYKEVILPAWLRPQGYTVKGEYVLQDVHDIVQVTLYGNKKRLDISYI